MIAMTDVEAAISHLADHAKLLERAGFAESKRHVSDLRKRLQSGLAEAKLAAAEQEQQDGEAV